MPTIRRNQAQLTPAQWQTFLDAISALRGIGKPTPRYGSFVDVHVRAMSMAGMAWGVHTMLRMGVVGRNFLTWHRRYILRFEQQLQKVKPDAFLPYWDPVANPDIPGPLNTPAFVSAWGLERHWNPTYLPTAAAVASATARTDFRGFQRALESVHGDVHIAVGGDDQHHQGQMALQNSPADPLFWLHHANIDRIWAEWQRNHPAQRPANLNETLRPSPIVQGKVSDYQDINALNYSYA